ncbi:hypothetical protein [Butyrivibrio sp. WCD3002]|uniref:hypothetical protein n=1 Tax=Butyrivibrio sp. WCD3002 TaxID=1280676 RepID=UPI00041B1C4B|nr:hypothetical protein [Butyrivibrio sp. WCD3002]
MIEYRKAVENDRASIEDLFIEMLQTIYCTDDVEGYEEGYLNRYFSDHEDEVIVAVDNGQVVAFLSVQVFRGDNYIYLDATLISDFRVSEQYQLSEKPGVTKQVVYYLAKYIDENPRVVRPQEVRSLKSLCLEDALAVIEYESKKE